MIKLQPIIKNQKNEKIDTWVEWDDEKQPKANVVMVHGFGTDKHETAGYFDDISSALVENNYRVIRFDFTGYGLSEGEQRDACYTKHIGDLRAVLEHTTNQYPEDCYIFAQSMGCFVTAMASPDGIKKTLMTGIPNADTSLIINRVVERFGTRPGAKLDLSGVSLLPRSTGKIQEIGTQFWSDIKSLKPVKVVQEFAKKTQLLIVSWKSDEIIGKETIEMYDQISELTHIYLPGDHSVTNPEDRQNFINKMLEFYNNT